MPVTSEVLTADQMSLIMNVQGQTRVGVNLSGTWGGTVAFQKSFDGVTWQDAFMRPFASGTTVKSSTANGNWEDDVLNAVAYRFTFTRTSGSAQVKVAASVDGSYQLAFLAASSIFVSNSQASGSANVITVAAQANRRWRVRTVVASFSAAPANDVLLTIADGATTIWAGYVPKGSSSYNFPLPLDTAGGGVRDGGVAGSPNANLVITLADPGAGTAKLNAEIIPA